MPIVDGKYVAPLWKNNAPPSLDASELNAMSDAIERGDKYSDEPLKNIGDIIFTERKDLGDKYLLCNGDLLVDKEKYSKLWDILPFITPNNKFWDPVKLFIGEIINTGNWSVAYGNGYLVIFGFYRVGSTNVYKYPVYYSTNNGKTWSSVFPFVDLPTNNKCSVLFDGENFVYVRGDSSGNSFIKFNLHPEDPVSSGATIASSSAYNVFKYINNSYVVGDGNI